MDKVKLKYNPNLSIKENAERCGVSESAVRKYIRTNGIDRNYDNKVAKKRAILALRKEHPDMPLTEMSRRLGYAVNTIKKYLNSGENTSDIDTQKVSTFDISNHKFIIKSVSDNQTEILLNILRLHVRRETFDCDLTYSKGIFYQHISQPKLKFDKYPLDDTITPLEKAMNIEDASLHSIVIDLPFIVKDYNSAKTSMIAQRFNYFSSIEELYETNKAMISLAFRKLHKNGFLVMKTMDFVYALNQYWVSNFVQNTAKEIGFTLLDTFILVSRTKILTTKGEKQHFARKFHSYFFVFRKGRAHKSKSPQNS